MINHQRIFCGHSDLLPALTDYRPKAGLVAPATQSIETAPTHEPPAGTPRLEGIEYFGGGLFEVFVPPIVPPAFRRTSAGFEVEHPPALERSYALERTMVGISALLRLERDVAAPTRIVRRLADWDEAESSGELAAILHLADADAIDPDHLDALHVLYAAGVRSLAITWSRANAFGFGAPYCSPGSPDVGPGLSPAGKRLVAACNELGVLVDLAHLSAAGVRDVAAHTRAPLVVTHAAAHRLTPTSRALTDDQLDLIASSGGLVGVSTEGVDLAPAQRVPTMIEHVTYMVDRIGLAHVGLGSDLYQARGTAGAAPRLLLPELLYALVDAGYSEADVAQLTRGNWYRVFSELL